MMSLFKIFSALLLSMTLVNCAMFGSSSDEEKNMDETSTMSEADKEAMDAEPTESEQSVSDAFVNADEDEDDTDMTSDKSEEMDGDTAKNNSDESAPEPARAEASAPFKDGMYTFPEDCTMREDPESSAPSAGTVRSGKKLWVEGYDNNWVKVYKRSGAVFVSKSCL